MGRLGPQAASTSSPGDDEARSGPGRVQVPKDALEKAQVRVIASEDRTALVFDPDQPVGKLLAKAGDFVEIPTTTAKPARRSGRGRAGALDLVAHECGVGLAVRELELDAQPPK